MAEGTFFLQAIPLISARRAIEPDTPSMDDKMFAGIQKRVLKRVRENLDWLEAELSAQTAKWPEDDVDRELFLVGDYTTAADTMMALSVGLCLQRVTNTNEQGERYKCIEQWMGGMNKREALKKAMKRVEFRG